MKLFFVVFVSALALSAADPQAKKDTSKESASATAKAADASKPSAIPADAVKDADGDYHYTDAQGKKWIYHKTPFGVSRMEDTGEREAAKAAAPAAPVSRPRKMATKCGSSGRDHSASGNGRRKNRN